LAVPLTLLPLPLYYARLVSGHAVIWPFTVASLDSALLVSALALLAGVFVSPLLVRALLAVDTTLARTLLAPPGDLELTQRWGVDGEPGAAGGGRCRDPSSRLPAHLLDQALGTQVRPVIVDVVDAFLSAALTQHNVPAVRNPRE
jgi:hypothetical protein